MSLEQVQQCLIKILVDAAIVPAEQTAWENTTFNPTKGTPWVAVHFMPASEIIATLGGDLGQDQNDGLFQVNLYIPKGAGEASSRETIENLRTCYRSRVVTYQGQPVLLLGRYRSNGMVVDDFFSIPFTVRWRAFIPRVN